MDQKNNEPSVVEVKLDLLIEKIDDLARILEKNTDSLIIHEKRTDLAEHKLKILQMELDELKRQEREEIKEINDKLEPISIHVHAINILVKYVVPATAAIVVMLYKLGLFDHIKS